MPPRKTATKSPPKRLSMEEKEEKRRQKRLREDKERSTFDLFFPGVEVKYPEGFPRAEWDTPREFDPQNPPGRSFTLYNFRTGGYEWSFSRLSDQPSEIRSDYFPPGTSHSVSPNPPAFQATIDRAKLEAKRAERETVWTLPTRRKRTH